MDVKPQYAAAELIDRLTAAFEIALQKAAQLHADGGAQKAVGEMLAIAGEIIEAILVLIGSRRPHVDDDRGSDIAAMQAKLEATATMVATRMARPVSRAA